MCTLRDAVVFFAGAEAMHTVSHVIMHFYVTFPINASFGAITAGMNNMGIVVNGVITVLLLVWAKRLSKKHS